MWFAKRSENLLRNVVAVRTKDSALLSDLSYAELADIVADAPAQLAEGNSFIFRISMWRGAMLATASHASGLARIARCDLCSMLQARGGKLDRVCTACYALLQCAHTVDMTMHSMNTEAAAPPLPDDNHVLIVKKPHVTVCSVAAARTGWLLHVTSLRVPRAFWTPCVYRPSRAVL